MNRPSPHRRASSSHRTTASALALALAAFGFAGTMPSPALAATTESAKVLSPVEQAAQDLHAAYREQQFKRLAKNTDRDSLIAAALLGMPNEVDRAPVDGYANVTQRLANHYGHDPLALFTLALSCQMQGGPCSHPESYSALVRIAPDNAVHWLLVPKDGGLSDAQLHAAAAAPMADTHLRDMIRIVRAALAGQPAPALRAGVDADELAAQLRRGAVDQAPIPVFFPAVSKCKGAVRESRTDCIALGRLLENDRSGTILSRMIGSVLIRRLDKGTPEEAAAKELRRDYVWMSEQMEASKTPYQEQLQKEVVAYGEWDAWQRAVVRTGAAPTPAADWIPKNPQMLLMSEERTPAHAQ